MLMSNAECFEDFRQQAVEQQLCFAVHPHPKSDEVVFNVYYNLGDIYFLADPQKVRQLVDFARQHAIQNHADEHVQNSGYGLLECVCNTGPLNRNEKFVIWEQWFYDRGNSSRISLADWLEMWGYKVPAFEA